MKSIHHLPLTKFGFFVFSQARLVPLFYRRCLPFRHDAFEAQFARLGEHDPALATSASLNRILLAPATSRLTASRRFSTGRFIRADDARLR